MISTNENTCAGTQDISAATVSVSGKEVTLIDTPGFDDTDRTDADILELISEYLLETYARRILLTGIILLQPVTGNRVQGSERSRLRLFEKICGKNAFSHVIIATTMWSELASSVDGESRVRERISDFWGDMLQHGAQVVNHNNTPNSALDMVGRLVNKGTVVLQMQTELEKNHGLVMGTAAGQQLYADQDAKSKKLLERIAQVEKALREERAEKYQLIEEQQEYQEEFESLQQQQSGLKKKRVSTSVPNS